MANPAEVLLFLSALQSQDSSVYGHSPDDCARPIITEIFSRGNCGNLAIMMAVAFGARPVILTDRCHVLSDIDGRLYDIHGDVTDKYQYDAKETITLSDLMQSDMVNNYSFADRGPII